MKNKSFISGGILMTIIFILNIIVGCSAIQKEPVDYVNPYIESINQQALTHPIQLPNGMMRIHPLCNDRTDSKIKGLPLFFTGYNSTYAFSISPSQGESSLNQPIIDYDYDNEQITPYSYKTYLDNVSADIFYAPSYQSAMYSIKYEGKGTPCLIVSAKNGEVEVQDNVVSAWQYISGGIGKVYLYLETDCIPVDNTMKRFGDYQSVIMQFKTNNREVKTRYGISLINIEQARKNLKREILNYDIDSLAISGRKIWNEVLGRIKVKGISEEDKSVFYTSLYRIYERPVNISEDGKYFNMFDGRVYADKGIPFYTDGWSHEISQITHPLRVILDPEKESDIMSSVIRIAGQKDTISGNIEDWVGKNDNQVTTHILDSKPGTNFNKNKSVYENTVTDRFFNEWRSGQNISNNINDLIMKVGGREAFVRELEKIYDTLGYNDEEDVSATENNRLLYMPYLYNYAGAPWRTQKRVRSLLSRYLKNDMSGMAGCDDGTLSAFVVFSQLGFYPITPDLSIYVIGSPVFEEAEIHLADNKVFKISCRNYAPENKYIQSVQLNGKEWNRSWFYDEDLKQGGDLEFVMGKRPNKQWASALDAIPPSFELKN